MKKKGKKNPYISVAGVMGTGKTTAAKLLREKLDFHFLEEPMNENKFLASFYKEPSRWAFHCQMSYLAARSEQLSRVPELLESKGVIQDTPIYEDHYTYALAQHQLGYMNDEEFALYQRLFDTVHKNLLVPDLIVHLDASLDLILERINRRARNFERKVDSDYLSLMIDLQNRWVGSTNDINVLKLDAAKFDLINNVSDQEEFTRIIRSSLDI